VFINSLGPVKRSLAFFACLATLHGCGDPDVAHPGQSLTPAPEQSEVVEISEDVLISTLNSSFDGTRAITASLPMPVPEFAISVRLKPAGPAPSSAVFAEVTPPQPFLVGSISATHIGDTIRILTVPVTDVTEFTSILIVSQHEGPVKVYRENELVGEADPTGPIGNIVVGRGYKERYWTGEIEEFKIFDLDGATGSVEPANISDHRVIYDLHGKL